MVLMVISMASVMFHNICILAKMMAVSMMFIHRWWIERCL